MMPLFRNKILLSLQMLGKGFSHFWVHSVLLSNLIASNSKQFALVLLTHLDTYLSFVCPGM